MGDTIERFPLFPLGIVLLPGEVVPLHIFEERYRLMIGHCLDTEAEFGLIWLSDDGLRDIGCGARVTNVVERFEDGRMNILVQGSTAFRLLERIEDLPWPAGDVELLDDFDPSSDPELAAEARRRYADLVERATGTRPSEEAVGELSAFGMAATVEHPNEAKQALLELRTEDERMKMVAELCTTAMKRLDYAEHAAERASSNGSVPH